MVPKKAPKFAAGHRCEAGRIAKILDPTGINPTLRALADAGCASQMTAHSAVAGVGTTVTYLCESHFELFHAVPAD